MMRNQASDSAKTDKRKKNKIKCSGKTLLHFLFAKFGVVGVFDFAQSNSVCVGMGLPDHPRNLLKNGRSRTPVPTIPIGLIS